MVANTTGKNADRKIRKIGEASPTPNHKIAKGIHANGERLRKKLTIGRNAFLASSPWPNQSPAGMPVITADAKPQVTRNIEVIRSVNKRPLTSSSRKARRTARGAGNALSWKIPLRQTTVQRKMKAATTAKGKASDWMVPFFFIYHCARPSHIFTVSAGVSQFRAAACRAHPRPRVHSHRSPRHNC